MGILETILQTKQLRQQVKDLESLLEEITKDELKITELQYREGKLGKLNLTATHRFGHAIINTFVSIFKSAGSENYLEMNAFREDVGPFTVTIQRNYGKTPAERAAELQQRVWELETELAQRRGENERPTA